MVTCLECGREFKGVSRTHLRYGHGMSMSDYLTKHPGVQVWSAEKIAQIRAASLGAKNPTKNPEIEARRKASLSRVFNTPEMKAKVSLQAKETNSRPEIRARLSTCQKGIPRIYCRGRKQSPEHVAKRLQFRGPSKFEEKIAQICVGSIRQYSLGWYLVDFAYPEEKVVVEAQGCYWHACKDCFPDSIRKSIRLRDNQKRVYLERKGWIFLEVWEHDNLELFRRKLVSVLLNRDKENV